MPLDIEAWVAPARERGLKCKRVVYAGMGSAVAPARERGLKYSLIRHMLRSVICRSRKGAWIEIRLVYDKWVNLCGSLPQGSVD